MWSGSARPNGPGVPTGGVGRSRPSARARRSSVSHSLFSRTCHTSRTIRPPGLSAVRRLVNAASWSSKNIAPALLTTTSKLAGSKAYTCASACTKLTLLRPAAAARARPFASIAEDRSIPTTRPGATAAPACRVNAPLPHPRSSTSSPGASAAARSRTVRCSVLARSNPSASSDHCAPSGPSQACRIASFAGPAMGANLAIRATLIGTRYTASGPPAHQGAVLRNSAAKSLRTDDGRDSGSAEHECLEHATEPGAGAGIVHRVESLVIRLARRPERERG